MNIPLYARRWSTGKRTSTKFLQNPLSAFNGMDRFPRIRFPQKGLQSDSSVVSGSSTWVITRIEGSHSDGGARFFQTITKKGGMGRSGPIPFIRIVLPSSAGVNFTQVRQLPSESFVKTSWLGQWLKFHWECKGEILGSTKYRIRTKMV